MAKLTVVGSSNTDMVIKTPRFPLPGETIIGGEFFMFPGGKGGNQAVAAARMGGEVSFICCLGNTHRRVSVGDGTTGRLIHAVPCAGHSGLV